MEVAAKPDKKKAKYEDYEIEGWVDTLTRAEEIKADAEKMNLVKPLLAKKAKAFKKITSLADLREVAEKKMYQKEEKDA